MVFCSHCKADCPTRLEADSFIACCVCGKVICDDIFTDEPTFVKGPGGESRRAGVTVRSIHSGYSESFKRTLDKGVVEMRQIVLSLQLDESIVDPATRFYEIALQRNFTRGRRTVQVAAACLYIACRTSERPKPYLLIDFSETLSINVYVLGSVFLQLCQLLSLEEHNIIKRPVDPTLFVPRFTQKLLDVSNAGVSRTAMHIIASMKRDWMQTGRKPSGICGAALYISALAHGFKFLKSDIVRIVHICEVTLTKRLIEFENTESGSLTIEELENNAKELSNCKLGSKESTRLLCQHKEETPFANGLCKSCFQDFLEISGGLGGTDPPAFQLAEKIRIAKESAKESDEPDDDFLFPDKENPTELGHEIDDNIGSFADAAEENTTNNDRHRTHTIKFCSSVNGKTDGTSDTCGKFKDSSDVNGDESDGLSDIDDIEVNGYLNNEEEMRYKKIIWEEMNREYLEEQAAKMEAGQDLTKSKPKKDRRQKQDPNAAPAQTAAEAARQMLSKKRFSSKINYDALEKCLSEDVAAPSKKAKASNEDGDDNGGEIGTDKHLKPDGVVKENELGEEDEEGMDGYEFDNETAEQEWQFDEDGYEYGFDEDGF